MTVPAIDARLDVTVGDEARRFSLHAELTLEEGVLVLFGPSGVGKSLTLQAIAGLLPRVRGHLRVAGAELLDSAHGVDMPAHARRAGYVPQLHALFPFLDVAGNVAFGLPRAERRGPKVAAILEELGLTALATARPDVLSGGERQRVALARALVVEPRILLLDEPFASIDESGRASLRALVREVIDRRRIPTVLVTHARDEAIALGDSLVRLERGRTSVAGDPRALLGGGVSIVGVQDGPVEALPDGRARVALREAVLEGPADRIGSDVNGAAIEVRVGD